VLEKIFEVQNAVTSPGPLPKRRGRKTSTVVSALPPQENQHRSLKPHRRSPLSGCTVRRHGRQVFGDMVNTF
jgi:hypothetical protein